MRTQPKIWPLVGLEFVGSASMRSICGPWLCLHFACTKRTQKYTGNEAREDGRAGMGDGV